MAARLVGGHTQLERQEGGAGPFWRPSAAPALLQRHALLLTPQCACLPAQPAPAFPCLAADIMGAVGALGFTPMTYVLPLVLYLVARGPSLPAWAWWGNAGLAAALTLAGLAAAVGSIRLIVENIRTYQFYS